MHHMDMQYLNTFADFSKQIKEQQASLQQIEATQRACPKTQKQPPSLGVSFVIRWSSACFQVESV